MNLADLEMLVARLKEMNPVPENILFTDYSRRSFPKLDIEKPITALSMEAHLGDDGTFYIPLDSVPEKESANNTRKQLR